MLLGKAAFWLLALVLLDDLVGDSLRNLSVVSKVIE